MGTPNKIIDYMLHYEEIFLHLQNDLGILNLTFLLTILREQLLQTKLPRKLVLMLAFTLIHVLQNFLKIVLQDINNLT